MIGAILFAFYVGAVALTGFFVIAVSVATGFWAGVPIGLVVVVVAAIPARAWWGERDLF